MRSTLYLRSILVVLLSFILVSAARAAARPALLQEEGTALSEPATTAGPSTTLISYQGTLTDQNGIPVNAPAPLTMVFMLYDAATGGAVKWGPETQSVQVTDGQFNALLGSVKPITFASVSGDLWLDITVNSEQLAPRERIASVPYSVEAGTVSNSSITTAKLNVDANIDMHGYGLINAKGISALSSTNFDLLYQQNNDMYIKSGATSGTVYIGMAGAEIPLWVQGSGFFGGATYAEGAMNLRSDAVPLTFKESDISGGGSLWRMPLDGGELRFDASSNGVDFTGYNTPLRLHPNGTVSCGALAESNLQTPEERAAGGTDRFEAGEVLCWGVDRLELCATPNDRLVQAVADAAGQPIVVGAEPVKVVGPVHIGDYLVSSSVPGYAMASSAPAFGIVIAQALEDFDGERGIIKAMIRKM